ELATEVSSYDGETLLLKKAGRALFKLSTARCRYFILAGTPCVVPAELTPASSGSFSEQFHKEIFGRF
ncbi:MAG: hypothetical protein AAF680_05360, partial [Pseudomonadota bacterium]